MRSRYALILPVLLLGAWLSLREAKTTPPPVEKSTSSVETKTAYRSARSPASAQTQTASSPEVEELARWISEDSLCDSDDNFRLVLDGFKDESERRMQLYSALTVAAGAQTADDDCIKAMHTEDREDVLKLTGGKSSTACRFLRALTLTGQWAHIEFAPSKKGEKDIGLRILSDLASQDPANGIYPYFKLILLEGTELKQAFQEFLSAQRFESPLTEFYMRLRKLSQLNATAMLYSIELQSTAGVPDYNAGAQVAKKLIQLAEYKQEGLRWMERLVEAMHKVQSHQLHEPAIMIIEFGSLKSIAASLWEVTGPTPSTPEVITPEGFRKFFHSLIIPYDTFVEHESFNCRKQHEKLRETHTRFSHEVDDLNKRWQNWASR